MDKLRVTTGHSPWHLSQQISGTYWHRGACPSHAALSTAAGRWPPGSWQLCCWGTAAALSGSHPGPAQTPSWRRGPHLAGRGPSHYSGPAPEPAKGTRTMTRVIL